MSTQVPGAETGATPVPGQETFPADHRRPRMHGKVVFVTGGTRGTVSEHEDLSPRHPEVLRRTSGREQLPVPRSFGVLQDDAAS